MSVLKSSSVPVSTTVGQTVGQCTCVCHVCQEHLQVHVVCVGRREWNSCVRVCVEAGVGGVGGVGREFKTFSLSSAAAEVMPSPLDKKCAGARVCVCVCCMCLSACV